MNAEEYKIYLEYAERQGFCVCLDHLPMIPINGDPEIAWSLNCPLHKDIIEAWSKVKWQDEADTILAANEAKNIEKYGTEWARKHGLATELQPSENVGAQTPDVKP